MDTVAVVVPCLQEFLFSDDLIDIIKYLFTHIMDETSSNFCWFWRDSHERQSVDENFWLTRYTNLVFFQLFRMDVSTFKELLATTMERDTHNVIRKKYRGGRYPTNPEKSLLVFLRYLASQETLHSLGDRFDLVSSTVMNIVNGFLYITVSMKNVYIKWPKSQEEFELIERRFQNYPGTVGAVDGSHIQLKVPLAQHDSYVDRYQSHSINLLGICTYDKIFTYVFIGYPGSVHDSRVLSNSALVNNIETQGKHKYFPRDEYHLIGDSAFPIRSWLMTPYSRINNLTAVQRFHNKTLSADRVRIENTFAAVKQRWARLKFINTYSISKAIEIVTAACVLHNFCYLLKDEWPEDTVEHINIPNDYNDNNREAQLLGQQKRNEIAQLLWRVRQQN